MAFCITVCNFPIKVEDDQYIETARQTAPMFRTAPGLLRKDYVRGPEGFGGVYLWESRAAAEAWFSAEMVAQYTQLVGVEPTITWYDSLLTLDNRTGETLIRGVRVEAT